jgi:hypothetical protein
LEKFLDRFEDMHATQATEKVRRSVDSVDNLPVMSSLSDALCPGGTQQPITHEEGPVCINEMSGPPGICLDSQEVQTTTHPCGTLITIKAGTTSERSREFNIQQNAAAIGFFILCKSFIQSLVTPIALKSSFKV